MFVFWFCSDMFLCVLQYNKRHDCLFYLTIATFVIKIIQLYFFIYLFSFLQQQQRGVVKEDRSTSAWLRPLLHVDKVTWQRPVVAVEKVGNMSL